MSRFLLDQWSFLILAQSGIHYGTVQVFFYIYCISNNFLLIQSISTYFVKELIQNGKWTQHTCFRHKAADAEEECDSRPTLNFESEAAVLEDQVSSLDMARNTIHQ